MKIQVCVLLISMMLLSSCATTKFYQVYEASSVDNIVLENNGMVYEDENCLITYNLWGEGGNIGFRIYNKTDKLLLLDLSNSYFILNGKANDYFRNRSFSSSGTMQTSASSSRSASTAISGINYLNFFQTNSLSAQNTLGSASSRTNAINYQEQLFIRIPPGTYKQITEFSILNSLYRDCNLLLHPRRRDVQHITFSENNTPFTFSNRLTYFFEDQDDIFEIEHAFYVSGIRNLPAGVMIERRPEEFCGQTSTINSDYYTEIAPNRFFIQYNRRNTNLKH
ncbi:hypothetical protein QA597_10490 [Marinilabiliaceae bacterium ANBcel2]|nr:hypothetical protein [Marinilabiliaceae bacterium ANBcel2]